MKKTWIIFVSMILCVLLAVTLIIASRMPQKELQTFRYNQDTYENETALDAGKEMPETDSDNESKKDRISDTDKISAKEESLPQKYLFLGDSTSTCYEDRDNQPVTSYVSYLSEMRTSDIDCRAIAESTYSNIRPNNVLSQMDEITLSDYDTVFMLFGVNDYIICDDYENTENFDPETMGGALLTAIARCREANVKCFVILPFPCADQFIDGTDAVGNQYQSYVDSIKRICESNGIETIDFHTNLGITKENFKEYYIDAFHPNSKLHKKAAEYLNDYLGAAN